MADIKIHRPHRLGLTKARAVAWQWAEQVEQQFSMECTVIEGQTTDTVEFRRPGVTGQLAVAADHYTLDAQLGFLLGAFGPTIQAEIEKHLDALLAREAAPARPAGKKTAARKTPRA
ncbi:MAG: polyhydroxyalkanoic acid system family protein [Burkholderiaceae bacterium]